MLTLLYKYSTIIGALSFLIGNEEMRFISYKVWGWYGLAPVCYCGSVFEKQKAIVTQYRNS